MEKNLLCPGLNRLEEDFHDQWEDYLIQDSMRLENEPTNSMKMKGRKRATTPYFRAPKNPNGVSVIAPLPRHTENNSESSVVSTSVPKSPEEQAAKNKLFEEKVKLASSVGTLREEEEEYTIEIPLEDIKGQEICTISVCKSDRGCVCFLGSDGICLTEEVLLKWRKETSIQKVKDLVDGLLVRERIPYYDKKEVFDPWKFVLHKDSITWLCCSNHISDNETLCKDHFARLSPKRINFFYPLECHTQTHAIIYKSQPESEESVEVKEEKDFKKTTHKRTYEGQKYEFISFDFKSNGHVYMRNLKRSNIFYKITNDKLIATFRSRFKL
eukprot:GHVP01036783.1.p1 GENE.GHVP01036783.1~~GHVP01036783.1.p1  ORF type:complete len:346 (-),score=60.28 GHVP01036783.1:17-997(-)